MVDRRKVIAGAAGLTAIAVVGRKQGKIAEQKGEIKPPKKK